MLRKAFFMLIALLVAVGMGYLLIPTPAGAQNTDCYAMQGGNKWVCDNGGEMEFQTGAMLDVQAGATASFAGLMGQTAAVTTTVTNGYILTPTANVHPVTSAGLVTMTLGSPSVNMSLLIINKGAQTVRLLDTGNQKLTGVVNIGGDDAVQLYFDGVNWYQTAALVAN